MKRSLGMAAVWCIVAAVMGLWGCATSYQPKVIGQATAEIGDKPLDDESVKGAFYSNDFRYYLAHRLQGTPESLDRNEPLIQDISAKNAATLNDIYGEEYALIQHKRDAAADPMPPSSDGIPDNLRALCLSGGGIRSASFNAGVLQGLHELGLLNDIDYLSSVSGGSYIAGWYMSRHLMDDNDLFNPSGPQMRYLLSNGNYLTSGHAGSAASDFAKRGVKHTLTVPFHWLFNGVFDFNQNIGGLGGMSIREVYRRSLTDTFLCDYSEAYVRDMGLATIRMYQAEARRRLGIMSRLGQLTDKMVPDAIQDAVPGEWVPSQPSMTDILRYIRNNAKTDVERARLDTLANYLETEDPNLQSERWREVIKQLASSATLSSMADYKKRPPLIRRSGSGADEIQGEPREWHMTDLRISETGRIDISTTENNPFSVTSSIRPFWVANAGLGLRDDKTLFKNQFGDNFELTPLYCGADAIGYVRTDAAHEWMGLSYVLQVSGAAVSYTNDLLPKGFGSIIRAFNLDLGLFIDSWSYGNGINSRKAVWGITAFYPFYQGLNLMGVDSGHRRNFKARRHFISDGGFYENLGALSVIRRGCRFVIISDSGQDQQYLEGEGHTRSRAFFDLRRLGLRLRNELGAELILPERGDDFSGPIMTGEIRNLPVAGGGRETVKIIYIKPTYEMSQSAQLPRFIEKYKASEEGAHFPHQSTGDQFFGEVQLTAYRELGYQTVIQNKDSFLQFKQDYSTVAAH